MSNILFGNAEGESSQHVGWFVGHFINPPADLRSTKAVEVKWGIHPAGEAKPVWTKSIEAITLAILIQGEFQYRFPEDEVVLTRQGDYVLWSPGVFHTWAAVQHSVILTIRWPSKPEDVVVADEIQVHEFEKKKSRKGSVVD